MHQIMIGLFTFDARLFRLSAAQDAPPAGCPRTSGAFCAADKQKYCASNVNKHIDASREMMHQERLSDLMHQIDF